MRKIIDLWKTEEIPQKAVRIFLWIALITFGVTTFGPVQMTERQLLRHIVQNPSGMHDLLFAAVPPLVAAIAVGITLTLWRLRYPSRR